MACAARVEVGPLRQVFWAVWDRREGRLRHRTRFARRGVVDVSPERPRVADGGDVLDLELERGSGVEACCPSGAQWAWTRKTPLRARGSWRTGTGATPLSLRGVLDESAGHHAREVDWRWSAGIGVATDGRPVAWNLVTGINDPARGSERAVWAGEEEWEPPPAAFAADLSSVAFPGGEALTFRAEATRARRDRLGPLLSDYAQPFGTFGGTLPGGIELAEGFGVMERHRALW